MSRRYGRNQKRRHKAELAEARDRAERLEMALEMEKGLLQHIRKRLTTIQDAFLRTARIVENISKNSVALPVKQADKGEYFTDRNSIQMRHLMPVNSHIYSQSASIQDMNLGDVDLLRLEALVDWHQESMRAAVWLRFGDETVGKYFVSQKALLSMDRVDIERIMYRDIAAGFARLLQQGARHG